MNKNNSDQDNTKCYCKDYDLSDCKFCTPAAIENLAAELHDVYQKEAKIQGDVRHQDNYFDLPENIKNFDRALAKFVIEQRQKDKERLLEGVKKLSMNKNYNAGQQDVVEQIIQLIKEI